MNSGQNISPVKSNPMSPANQRMSSFRFTIKTLQYAFLLLGAATMLVPLLWMLSTSLKGAGGVFEFPPTWFKRPLMWSNYQAAWQALPFGRYYLNSLLVAGCVTAGQVITSTMAAYAFARLDFHGRDRLFFAYLATMMVPGAVTMIPVFILLRTMNWIDTYWALILPGIFTAYGTFMLRQFLMGIPRELEEAAVIDGCTHAGIFMRIILPLSKPALATLATFTFIGSWRDFMWPLVVTNSEEMRTLPVGLASFQGMFYTNWTLLMAASVLVMLPLLVIFIFNQRFFVESIRMAGLKG
jgi:multiple sugar transport system permease protein